MRHRSAVIAVTLAVWSTTFALAANQSDVNDCSHSKDRDRVISACTRIIEGRGETARDRADAYDNRGLAYYDKGDYDRAIADYDEAIRLDPKDASAHVRRGAAYEAEGNFDRAKADYDAAEWWDWEP